MIMLKRWQNNYVVFLIFTLTFSMCCLTLCGCIGLIVGGVAAVGTYAITHDSVTTSVDTSFQHAQKIARQQLSKLGELDETNEKIGVIKAIVEDATVKVTISKLTDRTVDITVAARRSLAPDTELARAILSNILRNL